MMLRAITAAVTAALLTGLTPAAASSPGQPSPVLRQPPGVYRFMVGDIRVTALSDGTVPIDLHALLRGTTNANTDAILRKSFLTNPVEASINAFLLEIGSRHVLVDTGAGDLFGPGNGGRLVESLAAAGVSPAQIDDILITHVHSDHSGGLVQTGRMTYPNAVIHAGKPDVNFFLDRSNGPRTGYEARYFDEAAKTLKPYVDAGKVRPFTGTASILPGITGKVHPGHTPGSAFYTLESRGERIVFIGDIIHVGYVQFPYPAITITFDLDQKLAAQVRKRAFTEFAARRTLIAAPHLNFPGVGHVRATRSGYEWVPVSYGNRDAAPEAASTAKLRPR